jgi:hypothetical protein
MLKRLQKVKTPIKQMVVSGQWKNWAGLEEK